MGPREQLLRRLPDPIIFGLGFPDLKLVMGPDGQRVESRSNENLRIAPDLVDEHGTFPMRRLLGKLGKCEAAHEATEGYCPMLFRPFEVWNDNFGIEETEWFAAAGQPDFECCPGIAHLRDICQTETQRRFLDLWIASLLRELRPLDWGSVEVAAEDALAARFGFPALIPEVWLNYMGPRQTADDALHLEENPQRVDFVLLAEGQKCVSEIDGPSHYADYVEAERRYVPDERKYTRNLKIERSLRARGWEIFRFSDFEVRTCPDDQFSRLIDHLPGTKPPPLLSPIRAE